MLPAGYTWSLAAIAMAAGLAMLWAFKRFSNQARIEWAKRQVRAQLYALRLYSDEPVMIFRAQKQLLVWNVRYLALMLRPTAVIVAPAALLFWQLDAVYGRRPLAPGERAVVTAQLADTDDLAALAPVLSGDGMVVETPPVRIPAEHRACWRILALQPRPANLTVRSNRAAHVRSVALAYPQASINLFGWGLHWLWWFFIVSVVTMLLLRGRLGVTL
jgi:hypothetical protein